MAYLLTFIAVLCWFGPKFVSAQAKNITTFQVLRDSQTLVSSNGNFEVGFFSPVNSTNRYVGVWYTQKSSAHELEVVWVANRDIPLNDSSGVLQVSKDGNLRVLNGLNKTIWSSNVTVNQANDSIVQLQDSGNLVLLSNSTGTIIWQSFDHPTDSFLPQMTFTIDQSSGEKQELFRSWKSPSDPSGGSFTVGVDTRTPPEVFLWGQNDRPVWRNGPWNGNIFIGLNSVLSIVNNNEGESFFGFSLGSQSSLQHFTVSYDGALIQRYWNTTSKMWETTWKSRQSDCDVYGKCGPFGSCKPTNSPICSCLKGFVPKSNTEWSTGNWTSGCVRRTPLECGVTGVRDDGFLMLENLKVPDNAVWSLANGDGDCSNHCQEMCSCLAYSYVSSIGCMIWNGSFIDLEEYPDQRGFGLQIRLASSELAISNQPNDSGKKKSSHWKIIVIVLVTNAAAILLFCLCHIRIKYLRRKYAGVRVTGKELLQLARLRSSTVTDDTDDVELGDVPKFELQELVIATNNFQESNKLGRGGFGTVYKGILENQEEVAIKRLSNVSVQGLNEFMTEVMVIAKLQHRNLVRLVGCCAEGDEKMLVYEYMPNKSLDALLFDPNNRERLDWKTRFNIIQGICRGLLYLHRDSRLKIIHRDLKASNILLDGNLTPKISDFGMARIFGGNQDQADTNRVVGTYGYMSPEYAMEGRFSEKSDIYSLGVLLLEILSGRRNSGFNDDQSLSLLGNAWKLWNENDIASLVDPSIAEPSSQQGMLRCIQVALLCVQELPEDRPTISMIISMIDNQGLKLPFPKQPGFMQRRRVSVNEILQIGDEFPSVNTVSLSMLSGR